MSEGSGAPQVSVIMPVYNAEDHLEAAVESILAQTFTAFELLVFDDGSTDRSPEIIEGYRARDPRVRPFRGAHAGYTIWLRAGVEEARGTFIARMDADDVARPERLALQVAYLSRHPECVALGAEVLLVDPDGRPIRSCGVQLEHEEIDAELMRGRGEAIPHPVAMFRRADLISVGSYRTEYETAEDLDLYLRLAERGRVANLPETLLEYRQHVRRVSAERANEQRRAGNAVLREARRRRGLEESAAPLSPRPERVPLIECRRSWARDAIEGRNLRTARLHARAVLRAEPLSWRSWQLFLRALLGLRVKWLKRLRSRRCEETQSRRAILGIRPLATAESRSDRSEI